MKQKFQKLKERIKSGGSILVFTLILLFLMLSTALSIAGVAVIERKASLSTGKSTAGFQVADSGVEEYLYKVKNKTVALNDATALGSACNTTTNQFTGTVGSSGSYAITFYDAANNQLTCSATITQVDHIKSVGTLGGTTRAVEVAVAAYSNNNGNSCDNLQLGPESAGSVQWATAIGVCRNASDSGYNDWYLPSAEELACFVGVAGATANCIWTRTPESDPAGTGGSYVAMPLTNGIWTLYSTNVTCRTRCVR